MIGAEHVHDVSHWHWGDPGVLALIAISLKLACEMVLHWWKGRKKP